MGEEEEDAREALRALERAGDAEEPAVRLTAARPPRTLLPPESQPADQWALLWRASEHVEDAAALAALAAKLPAPAAVRRAFRELADRRCQLADLAAAAPRALLVLAALLPGYGGGADAAADAVLHFWRSKAALLDPEHGAGPPPLRVQAQTLVRVASLAEQPPASWTRPGLRRLVARLCAAVATTTTAAAPTTARAAPAARPGPPTRPPR
jgi:hypothetical protein